MLCIGHRGARGHSPENTLASIRKALSLGAHAIEIDVHCCDNQLVVIHDDTVDRTTNGHGPVSGFTLPLLRQLDAGDGERVPLLSEVMDTIGGRAALNIELKGENTAEPVARLLQQYRQRGWPGERILVSSFDWALLSAFRQHDPHCLVGLLTEHPVSSALCQASSDLHSSAWNLHYTHVNAQAIALAHQYQQRVYAYTVNRPADIYRMQQLGVDGIFTDYPDRALSLQAETDTGFGNTH